MVFRRIAKQLAIGLIFVGLFIYTMAFPGTTSWFMLLFFFLAMTVLWLTTRILWLRMTLTADRLHLVAAWPLFLPTIKIRVENNEIELPALFRRQFEWNIQLPRGYYKKITIETLGTDFFGFFEHRKINRLPVDLAVYPEVIATHKISHHPEIQRYLNSNAPEIRQIRDYMPQDAMKHVDWKASFRREKLMVKEYEREFEPRLHLVFMGVQCPQFETLLSLIYSAKEQWQDQVDVRIDLIGGDSFLTIQPQSDPAPLLEQWRQLGLKYGKTIVFAPEILVNDLRMSRKEPFMIVTEAGDIQ